MKARSSLWLAGLFVALAVPANAAPVPSGDPASAFKPTVTVRMQPPDQLLAEVRYLAGLIARVAPNEKEAKEVVSAVDGAVDQMLGPDWRKAIDTARPVLAYATLDANVAASTVVVLVPTKDDAAFRKLLAALVGNIEEDKGTLRFELRGLKPAHGGPAVLGYARFANQHAYLTINDPAVIALNRIPTPAQVGAGDSGAAILARLFLDRVPEQFRQKAVAGVQELKSMIRAEQPPGGMMRLGMAEMLILSGPMLQLYPLAEPAVRDGQELTVNLRFDRKRLNLVFELALSAKSGTELGRLVGSLKPPTSLFPQIVGSDSAARGLIRATIPEDLRKLLISRIEAGLGQAPSQVPVWGTLVGKVGEKLIPTLQEGEVDLAAALRGPFKDDRYGIVAGLRLKDTPGVEQAFRDAVKALPKEGQAIVMLDTNTDGGMKVHKIVLPPLPEPAASIFGDSTICLAFRPDAVVAAFGANAAEGLRTALAATPKPCVHYMLEGSGQKLVPLVSKIDADVGKKFKAFIGNDIDRVPLAEVSIEGGTTLKLQYGNGLTTLMPAMVFLGRVHRAADAIQQAVPPPPAPLLQLGPAIP